MLQVHERYNIFFFFLYRVNRQLIDLCKTVQGSIM